MNSIVKYNSNNQSTKKEFCKINCLAIMEFIMGK